jgi:hypothetical protein
LAFQSNGQACLHLGNGRHLFGCAAYAGVTIMRHEKPIVVGPEALTRLDQLHGLYGPNLAERPHTITDKTNGITFVGFVGSFLKRCPRAPSLRPAETTTPLVGRRGEIELLLRRWERPNKVMAPVVLIRRWSHFFYGPMDFAGWFEAFLGGQWYTFDCAKYHPSNTGVMLRPIAEPLVETV